MVFEKELSTGQIIEEAWDVFRTKFSLILIFTLIMMGIRMLKLGYTYWRSQSMGMEFDAINVRSFVENGRIALGEIGMNIGFSIIFFFITLVIGAVYTLMLLEHYFEDERDLSQLIAYSIPRVFTFIGCGMVIWLIIMIPYMIISMGIGMLAVTIDSPILMMVIMPVLLLIVLVPSVLIGTFMRYKILVDDSSFGVIIKESSSMVLKNIGKIFPLALVSVVIYALILGFVFITNKYFGSSVWISEISNFVFSFILSFNGLLFLVLYLNMDWLLNKDNYEIME